MPKNTTNIPTRKPRRRAKSSDQSLKETAESVVVAFILAFIFRAYIVEAFVIPTGSMAPTLLGQHVNGQCAQCDYAFHADRGDGSTLYDLRCPMCFFPVPLQDDAGNPARTLAGDRILVQKYLYRFAEPKRYDVVVFKNPESPGTNFIKRLVGLPNEQLGLLDGNIMHNPIDPDTGEPMGWQPARKVDPDVNPRWQAVQRDVFQPIYHSRYVPDDQGNSDARRGLLWTQPWKPAEGDDQAWAITQDPERGAVFNFDGSTPDATLRFDVHPTPGVRADYDDDFARYPYNQPNGSGPVLPWLEDLRVAATVQPKSDANLVTLHLTARLQAGPERLAAQFDFRDTPHAVTLLREDGTTLAAKHLKTARWQANQPTTLELWHVDQTLLVFINGEEALRHEINLPFDQLLQRPAPPKPHQQDIQITVAGGPATLTDLQLDRDLIVDDGGIVGDRVRGAFPRNYAGQVATRHLNPTTLGPDQFFFVGDNSPASQDSRKWNSVNRNVANAHFDGDRGPQSHGKVPRNLLMGRAFFVYYPAPRSLTDTGPALIPNVADMRFIH